LRSPRSSDSSPATFCTDANSCSSGAPRSRSRIGIRQRCVNDLVAKVNVRCSSSSRTRSRPLLQPLSRLRRGTLPETATSRFPRCSRRPVGPHDHLTDRARVTSRHRGSAAARPGPQPHTPGPASLSPGDVLGVSRLDLVREPPWGLATRLHVGKGGAAGAGPMVSVGAS
jgi:hypothetical protein